VEDLLAESRCNWTSRASGSAFRKGCHGDGRRRLDGSDSAARLLSFARLPWSARCGGDTVFQIDRELRKSFPTWFFILTIGTLRVPIPCNA